MPKQRTNNLRWRAELFKLIDSVDEHDRPIQQRNKVRDIFYHEIGTTAQEKYLSVQSKTEVVKRIVIRLDRSITEKMNSIRIAKIDYAISRIYINEMEREMELSLSYVD